VLVAIDGLRVSQRNLDKRLEAQRPGDRVQAYAFRRDELIRCELLLAAAPPDTCYLSISSAAGKRRLREAWLSER
jgi:predicted metalloprotease with PDZ domain